jgi:hypothetical protein
MSSFAEMLTSSSAEPFYERAIHPEDCAILFGVPTDYAGFRRDLGAPNKDLVPNISPVWPVYRRDIVQPVERLVATAAPLGVTMWHDVTLRELSKAADGRRMVVILVSHWTEDRVELTDGLHAFVEVVEAVPETFDGFLDLLVCEPDNLAISLRDFRPRCIVRFATRSKVKLAFWGGFFEALFTSLHESPRPYMRAFNEVIQLFADQTDEQ